MHPVRTPFVAQLEETDCGPACLTAVLSGLGATVRLRDVSVACDVGRDGVSLATLARVAATFGAQVSARRFNDRPVRAETLAQLPMPAIVCLRGAHFVVVEGLTRSGEVAINDPAAGRHRLPIADFAADFSGVALSVALPDAERPGTLSRIRTRLAEGQSAVLHRWWRGESLTTRRLYQGAMGAGVLATLAGLAATVLVRNVVQSVQLGVPATAGVTVAIAAMLAVLTGWLQRRLRSAALLQSSWRRSHRLLTTMLELPPRFFHTRFTAELSTRPQRLDGAAMQVSTVLVGVGIACLHLLAITAMLGVLAPAALAWVTGGSLVGALVTLLGRREDADRAVRLATEQAGRDGEVLAGLLRIDVLKAEAGTGQLMRRWQRAQQRTVTLQEHDMRRAQHRARFAAAIDQVALVVASLTIAGPWVNPNPGIAFVVLIVVLCGTAQVGVRTLVESGVFGMHQVRGAERVVDDVVHQIPSSSGRRRPALGPVVGVGVTLSEVTFGYDRHRPALLTGVDLEVPAGERCFLVGPSGIGKSSVAALIAGTATAWSGQVLVGRPAAARTPRISYVPQRPLLLEGTVAENLLLGAPAWCGEHLNSALALVDLTRTVQLRGGAERALVRSQGANFSGGERQRLALARALVRQPDLLVLDEATSAVESPLEDLIFERLQDLGCTVFAVAHRLPGGATEREIVRLVDGRAVATRPRGR